MLRISKLADYGALMMVHLARTPGKVKNAKQLAEEIHRGIATVSKLLKKLAIAGLLQSQRGAQGGYQLARPPVDISLADIITAIEGQTGLTQCSHLPGECSLEGICSTQQNWQVINRAILNALGSVDLQMLSTPDLQTHQIDISSIGQLGQKAQEERQ